MTSWTPALIGGADAASAVDRDLDVQAVVAQQDRGRRARVARVAGEYGGIGELGRAVRGRAVCEAGGEPGGAHRVAGHIPVRRAAERHHLIEEVAHRVDHPLAADRVVAALPGRAAILADRVGPVQRVIQRAPPGVGRVEREPPVADRHHELRSGERGDLRVDVLRGHLERAGIGQQVADLGEERLVGGRVHWLACVPAVPGVDRRLQLVAPGEQRPVDRRQVGDDARHARPEAGRVGDTRGGQRLLLDERVQAARDLERAGRDPVSHGYHLGLRVGTYEQISYCGI